jgi:hypothetical protein
MAIQQLRMYPMAMAKAMDGEIDWAGGTIKATLHSSTYTPADADDYFNDATNELGNSGGYTAGGLTIGSRSIDRVVANSWTQQWAASTAYNLGEIRRPTSGNGFVYRVSVAGTSSGSQPTWPTTIGVDVVDGGVTWTCVGTSVVRLLGAALQWAAPFSATFRRLVIWQDTAGASSTDPLIGYISWGSDQVGGDGTLDITPDNGAWFHLPMP